MVILEVENAQFCIKLALQPVFSSHRNCK